MLLMLLATLWRGESAAFRSVEREVEVLLRRRVAGGRFECGHVEVILSGEGECTIVMCNDVAHVTAILLYPISVVQNASTSQPQPLPPAVATKASYNNSSIL